MSFSIIFDMDGVLIDSEPLWRQAEIIVFKEFLNLNLTDAMCRQTKGMRIDMVIDYWHNQAANPKVTKAQLTRLLKDKVKELIAQNAIPTEGSIAFLETLKAQNKTVGLCSSSSTELIEFVIDTLGIKRYFNDYYSTENEVYGKPHPAAYLTTAKRINTNPSQCIVFEDSTIGAIAAKAAGMKVIAIPEALERDERFGFCDHMIHSFNHITLDELEKIVQKK